MGGQENGIFSLFYSMKIFLRRGLGVLKSFLTPLRNIKMDHNPSLGLHHPEFSSRRLGSINRPFRSQPFKPIHVELKCLLSGGRSHQSMISRASQQQYRAVNSKRAGGGHSVLK